MSQKNFIELNIVIEGVANHHNLGFENGAEFFPKWPDDFIETKEIVGLPLHTSNQGRMPKQEENKTRKRKRPRSEIKGSWAWRSKKIK